MLTLVCIRLKSKNQSVHEMLDQELYSYMVVGPPSVENAILLHYVTAVAEKRHKASSLDTGVALIYGQQRRLSRIKSDEEDGLQRACSLMSDGEFAQVC